MPSFKMKFSGVTILQGVEFSIFPIDFEWALQQCSAIALPVIQGVALTGCNRTDAPCSVGRPTAHAPVGRPARPPAALPTTTDDRLQRAKQYWRMRASNKLQLFNLCYYRSLVTAAGTKTTCSVGLLRLQ